MLKGIADGEPYERETRRLLIKETMSPGKGPKRAFRENENPERIAEQAVPGF